MKVVVLYRPKSEHASSVESFARDFKSRHEAVRFDLLDVDGREGSGVATLYDIWAYPTILALQDDGSVLQLWQGEMLPLMDEVASYVARP